MPCSVLALAAWNFFGIGYFGDLGHPSTVRVVHCVDQGWRRLFRLPLRACATALFFKRSHQEDVRRTVGVLITDRCYGPDGDEINVSRITVRRDIPVVRHKFRTLWQAPRSHFSRRCDFPGRAALYVRGEQAAVGLMSSQQHKLAPSARRGKQGSKRRLWGLSWVCLRPRRFSTALLPCLSRGGSATSLSVTEKCHRAAR